VDATGSTLTVGGTLHLSQGIFKSATAYENVWIDPAAPGGATLMLTANTTVSGSWINNGTFNANGKTLTFTGGSTQTIGGASATTFADLVIDAGKIMVVDPLNPPTVTGSVTNNGALKQTQLVNAGTTTTFMNIGLQYYGVDITPTAAGLSSTPTASGLGSTTVTVYGNQACAGAGVLPLKRCYEITPTTAAPSSVKFYYTQAEMQTGQTFNSLNVWHYNGSTWDALTRGGDSGSCASGALNCYVEGTGITAYSPFQLTNSNPLAAPLETLQVTATPAGAVIAWVTTSELDTLGYHVYRVDAAADAWTRLTEALLASQAPGSASGYAYRWLDGTAQRGAAYRYRVTAMAQSGLETPLAEVDVQMPAAWLWLPAVMR